MRGAQIPILSTSKRGIKNEFAVCGTVLHCHKYAENLLRYRLDIEATERTSLGIKGSLTILVSSNSKIVKQKKFPNSC